MVKMTIDTNEDPVEDLQEAARVIASAIARRQGLAAKSAPVKTEKEETALDTGFLKITLKGDDLGEDEPTVNELLEKESITEEELTDLFKYEPVENEQKEKKNGPPNDDFIEIVDMEDD